MLDIAGLQHRPKHPTAEQENLVVGGLIQVVVVVRVTELLHVGKMVLGTGGVAVHEVKMEADCGTGKEHIADCTVDSHAGSRERAEIDVQDHKEVPI